MSGPVTTAVPTPQHNHLLARLSADVGARLFPHLDLVMLPFGAVLKEPGCALRYVYFPIDAVLSIVCLLESGASTEVAQVGCEGLLGVTSCMDNVSMPSRAIVTIAGRAWRLPAVRLNAEMERRGEMLQSVLCYTQSLMTQVAQIAACNRRHSIERQLCRWLLSIRDRLPDNRLTLAHETIAHLLGVRREGVTEAAGRLQKAGAIEYHHGHIIVLDRAALENLSCECYAAVRKESERLRVTAAAASNRELARPFHRVASMRGARRPRGETTWIAP